MTDFDYASFAATFTRLVTAHRLKLKPAEAEELARTYFRVLEAHPIEAVILAGKRCLAKHRQFPKAADWLAELPPTPPRGGSDVRQMSADEAQIHDQAKQLGYEDEPCLCAECEHAGVMHRPVRFVPTERGDGDYERAFNPATKQVEIVGHWSHGIELQRWYAARDHFFALKEKSPLRAMLDLVGVVGEREAGSDD